MAAKSDARLYEPSPRVAHFSFSVGNSVYVCFGDTGDYSNDAISKLSRQVEVYNCPLKTWAQKKTTGTPPPGLAYGACVSINEKLYTYGGGDLRGSLFTGTLSQLNTSTMEWKILSSGIGPMKKRGAGMVAVNEDTLGLFGGVGIPTSLTQSGATFVEFSNATDGRGWTNEFHIFNFSNGTWSSPPMTGSRPPPCSDFSFTTVDGNRAVVFGGYQPERGVISNDVYIIDFNDMNWTKIEPRVGESWPVGRFAHAACCLGHGGEHPQLLISGGLGNDGQVLKDCSVLDLASRKWKKLTLPDDVQTTRLWHSITASTLAPGLVEVIMFGGCEDLYNKTLISETTILRFKFTREWNLVGVVTNEQRAVEVETDRVEEDEKLNSYQADDSMSGGMDQNLFVEQNEMMTDCISSYTLIPPTNLAGIHFDYVGMLTYSVDNIASQSLQWNEHGLNLCIEPYTLKGSEYTCAFTLGVTDNVSDSFQLPPNFVLVSPIFFVTPSVKLHKPVTLEIEHCCNLRSQADANCLVAIVAHTSTSSRPPYNFEVLEGGNFPVQSSWGRVSVSSFCLFAIVYNYATHAITTLIYGPVVYQAHVYCCKNGQKLYQVGIATSRKLTHCTNVIESNYSSGTWSSLTNFEFKFDGTNDNTLSFILPEDRLINNEWKISADCPPCDIKRSVLDNYDYSKCELSLQWLHEDTAPVKLIHRIGMRGVNRNYFQIIIDPSTSVTTSTPGRLYVEPSEEELFMKMLKEEWRIPDKDITILKENCITRKEVFYQLTVEDLKELKLLSLGGRIILKQHLSNVPPCPDDTASSSYSTNSFVNSDGERSRPSEVIDKRKDWPTLNLWVSLQIEETSD